MTWLTWRQFRIPAVSVYAGLAVIGVILAITGPNLVGRTDFSDDETMYGGTILAVLLLLAVVGVFWGVPMITRELETGTHSLIWNQSVTRQRWLRTKLGFGGLTAMVAAGLLSLAVGWWASPIDALAAQQSGSGMLTRMSPVVFVARGIVPIGYAAFAFVLGVAVGIVLRRTVAAMAVTLVLLAAVMVAVPLLIRPYIVPATTDLVAIKDSNIVQITGNRAGVVESLGVARPAGAWVLANETLDAAGNVVTPLPAVVQNCLPKPGSKDPMPSRQSVTQCMGQLSDLGYRQRLIYQPGSHFWPLQWIETALLLLLSALLTVFCFRRIRQLS
ncbi:transporter [Actinocrispum wychmicini]|uniref:ABC-2 family transporter n=1 Tax=Actinocrispum wychmicini TaxID=1213861 RepID=A0A4R2JRA6_9PSEU|nr:transporter [Actinocrispum wychmicini]TCO59748.1 hypothetical protein EV192_104591 [Actinocrispum wychmicini]